MGHLIPTHTEENKMFASLPVTRYSVYWPDVFAYPLPLSTFDNVENKNTGPKHQSRAYRFLYFQQNKHVLKNDRHTTK